jgi:heparinase II/III-like protein/alginate lyase
MILVDFGTGFLRRLLGRSEAMNLGLILCGGLLVGAMVMGTASADEPAAAAWTMPAIALPKPIKHPVVACTADELVRLRAAWETAGPAHNKLAERFARADAAMKAGLVFPPEGGQHNQWYQCDACQMALKTVDAHHHKCSKCGKVYSGYPYDNVLYNRQHSQNLYRMEDAAWAWAVTGEKKYAEFAARVLLGYAERYLKYPMLTASVGKKNVDISKIKKSDWRYKSAGHLWEQTLNEAMGMIYIVTAYDLIHDFGALTDEQRAEVETKLIRAMAENIDKNRMGKSNWQTWHNAALLWAGAVLGDEVMARRALGDRKHGFAYQMTASVMPEGLWFENSWGYHYYTMMAMTHITEGARRLGIDLYGHPMMRKMYTLAFDYQMSDGSLPRFGDAVQDSIVRRINEQAYAAYGDERILAALSATPTWGSTLLGRDLSKKATPAQLGSKVFPGAGHAILRTNGPGKLSAAMTFGPYGGFHGHFDKLSFVLFSHGKEQAVDPGRAKSQAYRLPIHTQWYKSTAGHNAVLVDGKDQKGVTGKLLSFAANDSCAGVAVDAGPVFADVEHRRCLILTERYLVVVDTLESTDGTSHTFDWIYHNAGTGIACDLPAGEAKLGTGSPGFKYLQDVKAYAVKDQEQALLTVTGEKVSTRMLMLTHSGDQVFTATGPFRSVADRVPMVVVRRTGTRANFVTVIEPLAAGAKPIVRGLKESRLKGASWCEIHCGDHVDRVVFSWAGQPFIANFSVRRIVAGKEPGTVILSARKERQ